MPPADAMDATKALVRALGDHHESLAGRFPEAFADARIAVLHEELLAECDRTLQELERPTLRLAMMGTTCSGKSTLVNGLIGRRLAPMEAEELSAGVLRLASAGVDSVRCVRAHEPAEVGEWPTLGDRQTYDRIQRVMVEYSEVRKRRRIVAPEIVVEGEFLPTQDRGVLELPPDLGLEILDLPGLRSLDDTANLAVIQDQIGKSFSVVTLDYKQVSEEHREKLLVELRQVVRGLGGRTDLMVFVLNRVDDRSSDDRPLAERLDLLSIRIMEILKLPEPAVVQPLSSRLMYLGQCIWGPVPLKGSPATSAEEQFRHLGQLFEECGNDLARMRKADPEHRRLLRSIEDDVQDAVLPSEEDLRRLVILCRQFSGADDLWAVLRARLRESFTSVVVLPLLTDLMRSHDQLIGALGSYALAQGQRSLTQVAEKCQRLEAERDKVRSTLVSANAQLERNLHDAQGLLASNDYREQIRVTDLLGPDLAEVVDAPSRVKTTLSVGSGDTSGLVDCLAYDLLGRDSRTSFLQRYRSIVGLPPSQASELFSAYDEWWLGREEGFAARGDDVPNTWTFSVRADDAPATAHLAELERSYQRILDAAAQSLSAAAGFLLQAEAGGFKSAAVRLLEERQEATYAQIEGLDVIEDLRDQILADLALPLDPSRIRAPGVVDALTPSLEMREASRLEQTDTKRVSHKVRRWFFFSRTVIRTEPVMDHVAYRTLRVPDSDGVRSLWNNGLEAMRGDMNEALLQWVRELLQESTETFGRHVNEIIDVAIEYLNQREEQIRAHGSNVQASLEDLRAGAVHVDAAARRLQNHAKGVGSDESDVAR